MPGRVEQAEAGVLTKNASNGKVIKVSQTEITTIGGGPNGRVQFITYAMEMPISCCVHPEIQKKSIIWESAKRCPRNYKDIMPIQKG